MAIGIASGFALLSLVGGFFLNKYFFKENNFNVVSKNKVNSGSSGLPEVGNSYVPGIGSLLNNSITDYPFSWDNPDFTGAAYIGSDWFLMANGFYFNRVSKKWSDKRPETSDDNETSGIAAASMAASAAANVGKSTAKVAYYLAAGLAAVIVAAYKFGKQQGRG